MMIRLEAQSRAANTTQRYNPTGEAVMEILAIPETQAKTVVLPHSVTDDVSRKSVSAVAGRLARDRATLPIELDIFSNQ